MSQQKLIFHIGDAKAGSTAIQHRFFENQEALRERGILFPLTYWDQANHRILWPLVFGTESLNPSVKQRMGGTHGAVIRAAREDLAYVQAQITKYSPSTVVISTESFCRTLSSEDACRLHDLCGNLASQVNFYCYVREPVSRALSVAHQNLRKGARIKLPAPNHYKKLLSSYHSAFPGRVTARAFLTPDDKSFDTYADLAAAAVPDALCVLEGAAPLRPNVTMSAEAMVIAQRIATEYAVSNQQPAIFQTVETLRRIDAVFEGYSRPRPQHGFAEAVLRANQDLEWLRDVFGVKFPDIDYRLVGTASEIELPKHLQVEDICLVDSDRLQALDRQFRQATD